MRERSCRFSRLQSAHKSQRVQLATSGATAAPVASRSHSSFRHQALKRPARASHAERFVKLEPSHLGPCPELRWAQPGVQPAPGCRRCSAHCGREACTPPCGRRHAARAEKEMQEGDAHVTAPHSTPPVSMTSLESAKMLCWDLLGCFICDESGDGPVRLGSGDCGESSSMAIGSLARKV